MIFTYSAKQIAQEIIDRYAVEEEMTCRSIHNNVTLELTPLELQRRIEKAMKLAKERVEFHAAIKEERNHV